MQSNITITTQHRHWLNSRGISDEVLRLFNISSHEHPQIGSCIRIPYSDTHSKYRRDPLSDEKPKYLYDSGGKVTLYGANHLTNEHTTVVITEGELDTLVLWSARIAAVSSTGGAMSFQSDWVTHLQDKRVYVCFDNDQAGADGMVKVLEHLPEAYVVFIPTNIPGVKDISDYVAHGGNFRELMETARQFLTPEAVAEDHKRRVAMWQQQPFHERYLEKHRQREQRASRPVPTSEKSDKVLRAKDYPMDNLIEFTRRKTCCPWHNEKTPSLQYYPQTNTAYCFGACGRAYDAIDAYMLRHNVGFLEAVDALDKLV